jgi:hypothetical protein
MDIATNLKSYLKSKSAITSLVGSGDASRIFIHDAKEGVQLPFVVIVVLTGSSAVHLGGASGIASNRVSVISYGNTHAQAYELDKTIRLCPLLGYRGTMGTGYVHAVDDDQGYECGYDPPVSGSAQKRYWVMRDYLFTHKETDD